jgi:hypothetical protein
MCAIGERLKSHWSSQGISLPSGVTEGRLRDFEVRSGVALPLDMREYFRCVDGMGDGLLYDKDLFNFRPLSDVESIGHLELAIEDRARYFVFADHSIWLPAYAIRLTSSRAVRHPVVAIESEPVGYSARIVAHSFSEFADRYLTDSGSRDRLSLGMAREQNM